MYYYDQQPRHQEHVHVHLSNLGLTPIILIPQVSFRLPQWTTRLISSKFHCFRHTVRSAMTLMSVPIDVYSTNLLTSLRAHTQHVQLLAITPAFLRYLFVKHNFICSGESSIYSCGCRCEPDRLETSQAANKQLAVTLMSLGCTKVVAFGFNDRMLLLWHVSLAQLVLCWRHVT